MPRLTLILSLWNGWRPIYDLGHVRALVAQIRAHTRMPLKVALLADREVSPREVVGVDVVAPMPEQHRACPEVPTRPNCYRRIKFFDPAFAEGFGTEWIASLDLDTLVLGPLDGLLEYAMGAPSGLSIIRSRYESKRGLQLYNGAFFALRVGALRHVWDEFDWRRSPLEVGETRAIGSDQVWLALRAPGARLLGPERGVYFYEQHVDPRQHVEPAALVTFAGPMKPWSKWAKRVSPEYFDAFRRYA